MKLRDYIAEKAGIFDDDPEYQVRNVSGTHYQVTKWLNGKQPREVFDVMDKGTRGWSCNCPVRSSCKHIQMVKDWIKAGSPTGIPTAKDLKWKKL